MPLMTYHSTLFSDIATRMVATDTTSSQIFLSRGVAGAETEIMATSRSPSPRAFDSFLVSNSANCMTPGYVASGSSVALLDGEASSLHRLHAQGDIEHSSETSDAEGDGNGSGARRNNNTRSAANQRSISNNSSSSQHTASHGTDHHEHDNNLHHINQVRNENGKGKQVERGRSLEAMPRAANPFPRAGSRSQIDFPLINVDTRTMLKRNASRSSTFFEDPNDPVARIEDDLLEPLPHIPVAESVSDVLDGNPTRVLRHSTRSSSMRSAKRPHTSDDITPLIRAVTTSFNDCQLHAPIPTLTSSNSSQLGTYANQLEAMTRGSSPTPSMLSASCTSEDMLPSPKVPLAIKLPTEIVQQIFKNLSPADFNSARHSCRSWFIHSLNKPLMEMMLRRGGFSSSAVTRSTITYPSIVPMSNDTWLMSKRIARECALGPDWRGNGLNESTIYNRKPSSFVEATTVDFTEVAVHYPGPDSAGTIFTTSSCGKFLMAANGCLVYIYELNRYHKSSDGNLTPKAGHLLPVTSIICPRRVLACSMDTSSQRYAIAILMDGRMGLVCDIANATRQSSPTESASANSSPGKKQRPNPNIDEVFRSSKQTGTFLDRVSLETSSTPNAGQAPSSTPSVLPASATPGGTIIDDPEWQDGVSEHVPSPIHTAESSTHLTSVPRAYIAGHEAQIHEISTTPEELIHTRRGMHIEDGPRSLYRNLCSDDDPPRSVAICPQRRCVAFGCSSGIELHWVDALTGQDLNRWFPLTAPSDFLFFLPPRRSIDSAKKLRLISSSARPSEKSAISERSFGSQDWNSPFWERFGWGVNHSVEGDDVSTAHGILTRLRIDTNRSTMTGRMDCSDHYRAVPLSDGYHILFTDPATGLLCLGSDAPVGGPTKLLRKIWFKGPEGEGSPVTYTSGADLTWGVKVVAGFGNGAEQSIWVYSVPNDIFLANQSTQPASSTLAWLSPGLGREKSNMEWVKWCPDDGLQEWLNHVQDPVPGVLPRSVWPVKIRGQKIGTCQGLVDLVIDSGPLMTVWAFSKGGISKSWKLDDGKCGDPTRLFIQRDGTVRQTDGEGDVEMPDVSSSTEGTSEPLEPFPQYSLDGASTPAAATTAVGPPHRSKKHRSTERSQHIIRYDLDGDALQDDVRYPGRSGLVERESTEEIGRASTGGGDARGLWSMRCHRVQMRDGGGESTGISRIDVEIR